MTRVNLKTSKILSLLRKWWYRQRR